MKIRIAFCLVSIGLYTLGHSQSIPKVRLTFPEYNPTTFTPVSPDYSIRQQSLRQLEERESQAYTRYKEFLDMCNEIETKLPPSELDWFRSHIEYNRNRLTDVIKAGDYGSVSKLATEFASDLRRDMEVQYRMDSYKQYIEDILYKGSAYRQGHVDEITYIYWLSENQYHFNPKFDSSDKLIGYDQCDVSYLENSINWDEVYAFVRQRGTNPKQIEKMWQIYFFDKQSQLVQEFECYKFYLKALKNVLVTKKSDTDDLLQAVNSIESLILDVNNKPSFDHYIAQMMNQMSK